MNIEIDFVDLGNGRILAPLLCGVELERVLREGLFTGAHNLSDHDRATIYMWCEMGLGIVCYVPDGSLYAIREASENHRN